MDSIEDWDFLDFHFTDESTSQDLLFHNYSSGREIEFSPGTVGHQGNEFVDGDCTRKRFLDLSSILEPGRPSRTDKSAILDDAIRVLTQLRTEAQELKETNEKLLEEIKSLKMEYIVTSSVPLTAILLKQAKKNELREDKLVLKANKERIEQQLKTMTVPPTGYVPAHLAPYHPGTNKMAIFPSYGLVPMWQYLPPSVRDTSQDHELRPPAA
ncbi:bHLH104 protein [Hibiscus syriacus]|uniref:BHLH104 protein n=1 Tax=Hibiscus syriacus TaxID=106335 RepID=A0A6A3AEP3_HIBSY|nr:bHLH104 protein [Hibiscus syriacus]